jgi:hypothetical protein
MGKKKKKKAKPATSEEFEEEAAPCEESILDKELTPSRESGPEDAVLVVRSLGPDVGQSVCPFRARHILDGNGWKSCTKCRAMICQVSVLPRTEIVPGPGNLHYDDWSRAHAMRTRLG